MYLGTYIEFVLIRKSDTGKTKIWDVVTKDAAARTRLGEIRWFGRWRSYAFFPAPETLYEATCLIELASFIRTETANQRRRVSERA